MTDFSKGNSRFKEHSYNFDLKDLLCRRQIFPYKVISRVVCFQRYSNILLSSFFRAQQLLCVNVFSRRTAVAPVKPPEPTVLLLAGSGSLRVRGSPRWRPQTPHPQTNYCRHRPQRHQWQSQWQSRHKHSTSTSYISAINNTEVYYYTQTCRYTRGPHVQRGARVLFPKNYALCWRNAECCVASQNYAGIIYASLACCLLIVEDSDIRVMYVDATDL